MKITYLYPDELNLYGDTGNVEILRYRCEHRGFSTEVDKVTISSSIDLSTTDILFMGGGPDSGQQEMYKDLVKEKSPYIKDYIENNGIALFICGAYQLMGNYYKSADSSILDGLGIFDLYTEHFGHEKPRSVGNTLYRISSQLKSSWNMFMDIDTIVGFENHGGQTFLSENIKPFAEVLIGNGNNLDDLTEGAHYKNAIGTYSHGPVLSKNPHLADYLISKALNIEELEPLDDTIALRAHTAMLSRLQ